MKKTCSLLLFFTVASSASATLIPIQHTCPEQYNGYKFAGAYYMPEKAYQQIIQQVTCEYGPNLNGPYLANTSYYYHMPIAHTINAFWKPDSKYPLAKNCVSNNPANCPFYFNPQAK